MTAAPARSHPFIPAPPLTAPVDVRAKAVWEQMLLKPPEPGFEANYYGLPGRAVRANVRTIVRYLWPALREEARERELEAALNDIRAHLGKTNSARCLARHGDTKDRTPVWWVSHQYEPISVHIFRMTNRERRLTAHEAGEDREPEPVVVRHVGEDPMPEDPAPTSEPEDAVEDVSADAPAPAPEDVPIREVLLQVLHKQPEPITRNEWSVAAGYELLTHRGRFTGPSSQVVSAMTSLIGGGQVFTRLESAEERKIRGGLTADDPSPVARGATLHWPTEPVPPRTQRVVVPGFLFSPRVFTYEEKAQATLKGLAESKRRVLEVLAAMGPDSFITMSRLASVAGVSEPHAVTVFNELLNERLLQVRRKGDDFWRFSVRLAGDRRATNPDTFHRRIKKSGTTTPKGIDVPAAKPSSPQPGQDIAQFVADYIESEVSARVEAALANRDSELVEAQDRVSELEAQVSKLKTALKAFTE